ncbi:hypothetical protein ACLMJK_006307 [Lecanora helva]
MQELDLPIASEPIAAMMKNFRVEKADKGPAKQLTERPPARLGVRDGDETRRQKQDERQRKKSNRWRFWETSPEESEEIVRNLYRQGVSGYNPDEISRPHTADSVEKSSESKPHGGTNVPQITVSPLEALKKRPRIVLQSPHRHQSAAEGKKDNDKELVFSKETLTSLKKDKLAIYINLYAPTQRIPLNDLAPLNLYRNLRSLCVIDMMHSYQSIIWEVVWINPQMRELELGMAENEDLIKIRDIVRGRHIAQFRPTIEQQWMGIRKFDVSEKLSIELLVLTNFKVTEEPFTYFDPAKFKHLRLSNCKTENFHLPKDMQDTVEVVTLY